MDDRPLWIEMLMRSGLPRGCFESRYAPFRQGNVRQSVFEAIGDDAGRSEELRVQALKELENPDVRIVERALAYLLTVGKASDVERVEMLADHPAEYIRKGTRTCVFELRRKKS